MKKYLKTTGIFFGVWFIASLLNGLLCGISLAVLESSFINSSSQTLVYSMFFSFVFSAPVVGLVWFIAMMAQLANKKGDELFQFVLGSALLCAVTGALLFIFTVGKEFMNARYVTGLCIIISALSSVLFFRKQIKTNE
jgi:predicted membrane-bound spermidine synthase